METEIKKEEKTNAERKENIVILIKNETGINSRVGIGSLFFPISLPAKVATKHVICIFYQLGPCIWSRNPYGKIKFKDMEEEEEEEDKKRKREYFWCRNF